MLLFVSNWAASLSITSKPGFQFYLKHLSYNYKHNGCANSGNLISSFRSLWNVIKAHHSIVTKSFNYESFNIHLLIKEKQWLSEQKNLCIYQPDNSYFLAYEGWLFLCTSLSKSMGYVLFCIGEHSTNHCFLYITGVHKILTLSESHGEIH